MNNSRTIAWLVATLIVILVFALWPVASISLAQWFASANGCLLHEGAVNPCVIGGSDWGGTLYSMFVIGWFMIVTLPLGVIALAVWAIIAVIHMIRRSNRRDAALS